MTETPKPRHVTVRRMLTLTTAATSAVVGMTTPAAADLSNVWTTGPEQIYLAASEGEGEGAGEAQVAAEGEGEGGGGGDSVQDFQRDIGFMEGHLRAGLALYEAGDLAAAKTHMGHPINEKYDAVAEPLKERGHGNLREQIATLSAAAEAEVDFAAVKAAFDAAQGTLDVVREDISPRDQILGLSKLVRVAGEEYSVAVEGGTISNLHEYQDAWGFLRVVEAELNRLATSEDEKLAHVAKESLEFLAGTDAAFGDIQGQGDITLDPSLIFAAAARIELEALELD